MNPVSGTKKEISINPWKLTYDKFDTDQEGLREALCTLGNGYFGTRGAASEVAASRVHYPATYIAGVYNELVTEVAGREVKNEDFVNCPNWLMFTYRINNGKWFDRLKVETLSWKKELNMRKGMLSRRLRWRDDEGRVTLVENHRIVSMAHPHFGAMRCTIIPENYEGTITIRVGIDGLIINAGVERYRQLKSKHLEPCSHGTFGSDGIYLQTQTNQSKIQITEAARTLVYRGKQKITPKMKIIEHGRERIIQEFTLDVKRGEKVTVEKLVSIYTSRDHGVSDDCLLAQETISKIENFEHLYKPHVAKWRALWRKFDIEVDGHPFIQQVLRLHTFHLLQTASTYNEDIDTGFPARGLHGEAYRGHIFWDELYVYPFYNLHAPEITRALLMYRYRRLPAAKANAAAHGYKGAMYPWQSASRGDETTQIIHLNPMSNTWGPDYSSLQRHVSLTIAYNVWTYFYTTGARGFLERYGAEMILEIAHFWSSMTSFNNETGRYEIAGVMGPDEFHEKYPGADKGGLKNNAYTNVMVVWLMDRALHILSSLPEEERMALMLKTEINDEEIQRWEDISRKMTVSITKDGIIEQFEGYMKLKELDWDEYRAKYDNIHRIDRILKAEGLSPDSYKVAKQADTLMLFYVLNYSELETIFKRLGYKFNRQIMKKNFEYYIQRTSHGSTLSRVVHAFIAERLGDNETFMEYFMYALRSDIEDTQGGTTQEGIHSGVMGGTIDVFLRGFAGLTIRENRVSLKPDLPKDWSRIKFHIRYKNIWFGVELTQKQISVTPELLKEATLMASGKVPVEINKTVYDLVPNKTFKLSY